MRPLFQLAIILVICLAGEFLHRFVGIPIPGNILGMLLLFVLLCLKIVRLEHVEGVSTFFLKNLAFFFLPAGVGLMNIMHTLHGQIIAIFLISVGTTATTIAITGRTVQFVNKMINKQKNKKPETN